MFRKIIDYLNLRQVGGLELFFALSMVLSAYSFMGIPMQVILWGGLFAMLFFKRRSVSFSAFRPLLVLAIFVLIHDFLYLFIANGNLNAFIMQILYFGCMLMAVNVFNIEKLKGSLNLVAIISMIGLVENNCSRWRRTPYSDTISGNVTESIGDFLYSPIILLYGTCCLCSLYVYTVSVFVDRKKIRMDSGYYSI